MNLSVSPIPFPLVFSWLYVLHPNPIAKTPTDRQGGQPRSDHDDPATYEWGGSKNINPPYHLITQETILVKKRVVCCERWPTKFGLRKNPKCRSRCAVPALPPVCCGRQGGRPSDRDGGFLNQGQWGSGRRGKVGEGRGETREEGKRGKQGRIGQHVHTRTQPRTVKGAAEED